jgi:PBP1b-binding outer membrane lipoprotein LpoB
MRQLVGVALLMLVAVLLGGCQVTTRPEAVTTSPANGATDVNPTRACLPDLAWWGCGARS